MERAYLTQRNRSAEKHSKMTNTGSAKEGTQCLLPAPPTHLGARETDEH